MLTALDIAIVAIYIGLTLLIGFWSARHTRESTKSFFVAEGLLPWWVVGFTMVAASISAEQMLGEVGYAKDAGLVISNWDLGVFPSLVLMLFVFLPLYLRHRITTIPEYLEKRYDRTTRLLFATYTVLNNACITLVMVLALGAKAIQYFTSSPNYEGVPVFWGAALLALFTGAYTVYGGMSSVAWTDTFQCILLLAGGLVIFGVGLAHVPGGWAGLFQSMPDAHLIRGIHDPYMPWPGLLLLILSTNVWYCCTNQFYVQSTLGAKDAWHGRMGVLLTAFLGPVLTLCFAFPGYIASHLIGLKVLNPAAMGASDLTQDANFTYPALVYQFLGPGLRGFLVAAVLAAIMSTVSSIVNATASVFSVDIYQRWIRPASSDERMISVGRTAGLATLLIAFPLSLQAVRYRYIFTYSQNAWCILAIPIMLVFTLGALWRRTTASAANALFLAILPFVIVPFAFGNPDDNYLALPWLGRVHLFNFAFALWICAAVFIFLLSLSTRPDPRAETYVWEPGLLAGERARPWYQSIPFWSGVAGLIYVAIYLRYW